MQQQRITKPSAIVQKPFCRLQTKFFKARRTAKKKSLDRIKASSDPLGVWGGLCGSVGGSGVFRK